MTQPINGTAVTTKLSAREEEVLRLMAWGYSIKEISVRLDFSAKTAETYKMRAAKKLGLSSRVDLVRYALQHNWYADDPDLKNDAPAVQDTLSGKAGASGD